MNDLTPEVAWVYELQWPNTNEIYIGSTSHHPEQRFKGHKGKPHKCYAHLGIENAKLAFCYPYTPRHNLDREEEKRWKEVSRNYGYTVLDDGDPHCTPLRMSEEVKRKRSKAIKRLWTDPDHKRKMSEAQLGKKFSEDHKRNLSEAMNRPETILKQRLTQGQPFTCIWPDGRIKHYLSLNDGAADLGVGHMTIRRYLKGTSTPGGNKRTAHLKGCIFQYV